MLTVASRVSGSEQGSRVLGRHVGVAPIVGASPNNVEHHARTWVSSAFCENERVAEDPKLLRGVIRRPDGIPERKVGEGEPWHANLVEDVSRRAEDQGRHSRRFEMSCGQTDRLMAHGSKRNEKCEVDIVLDQHRVDLVGANRRPALAIEGGYPHEPRCHRTNDALSDQR